MSAEDFCGVYENSLKCDFKKILLHRQDGGLFLSEELRAMVQRDMPRRGDNNISSRHVPFKQYSNHNLNISYNGLHCQRRDTNTDNLVLHVSIMTAKLNLSLWGVSVPASP